MVKMYPKRGYALKHCIHVHVSQNKKHFNPPKKGLLVLNTVMELILSHPILRSGFTQTLQNIFH